MPSQEYKAELDHAWDLHVRKNAGYAGADNPDPWANFRMCEAFGITAFQGCMVRMSDKYIRVTNLMRDASNDQVGESIIDTLRDLAAYALIGVVLLGEQTRAKEAESALHRVGQGRWTIPEAMRALGLEEQFDKVVADLKASMPQAEPWGTGDGEVVAMPMSDIAPNCGLVIAGDLACERKRGHRGECYHS